MVGKFSLPRNESNDDIHEYEIESNKLDYFTKSEHAYFFGPTTIKGSDYDIYCSMFLFGCRLLYGVISNFTFYNWWNL